MNIKHTLKKTWNFIWNEDSVASWLVNVILAFVLVKFIIYPGLGLLLGTHYPVVAVVSGSMEHDGNFENWWQSHKEFYDKIGINKEEFTNYPFSNGFNKGDLMILYKATTLHKGDVIVFQGEPQDPIIHRIVKTHPYQTKGDHNTDSRRDETAITQERILGKAIFRIPYLGWFKLGFVYLLSWLGLMKF